MIKSYHDLVPFIEEIYSRNMVGCCWHVLLDDGNCDYSSIKVCSEFARSEKCAGCIALADAMAMPGSTATKLSKASRKANRIYDPKKAKK